MEWQRACLECKEDEVFIVQCCVARYKAREICSAVGYGKKSGYSNVWWKLSSKEALRWGMRDTLPKFWRSFRYNTNKVCPLPPLPLHSGHFTRQSDRSSCQSAVTLHWVGGMSAMLPRNAWHFAHMHGWVESALGILSLKWMRIWARSRDNTTCKGVEDPDSFMSMWIAPPLIAMKLHNIILLLIQNRQSSSS